MDFIKVGAACPKTRVADIVYNIENICHCIEDAKNKNIKFLVFPELCVTSYTCGDLFLNSSLINASIKGLESIVKSSIDKDMLIAVGAPLLHNNVLYNCAYLIFEGNILGIVPKSYIPNYSEFYEKRWFTQGVNIIDQKVNLSFQKDIPFGTNLIFNAGDYKFGVEICEDLWVTIIFL